MSTHPESNRARQKNAAKLAAELIRTKILRPAILRHEEKRWNVIASGWEVGGASGLGDVVNAVLAETRADASTVAVDLGSGTGQLALPLAKVVERVWAVDISAAMLDLLVQNALKQGSTNVEPMVASIEGVAFPPASIDLVVTNYALHHLMDRDKEDLIKRVAVWLKPGGRIVIGDMMFGRGSDQRDREIIKSKVASMARKGPAGWWRIAKNLWRFSFRVQERPVRIEVWERYLRDAGFEGFVAKPVVAEAVVVVASRPS